MSIARSLARSIANPLARSLAGGEGAGGGGAALLTGDRYVSPTGDDNADGLTRDTAWATFGKLTTWANAQTTNSSAVIMQGSYGETVGTMFLQNANAVTVTLNFEAGVIVDTSTSATRIDGFNVQGDNPCTWIVNLRGAQFFGNNVNSANGIGTTGNANLTINGADGDGNKAVFSGYDDGISFHGTSGAVDAIQINDCRFTNCTKGAFVHVNSSRGTHTRCRFEGRVSATLGIGSDQSTVKSEFYDCDFIPAVNGQPGWPEIAFKCRIGTPTIWADQQNSSANASQLTDCFVNMQYDGPGNVQFVRCYGYLNFDRIRGTTSPAALFDRCVFEGRTNTTAFVTGDFSVNDGNWLGGSPIFRDCVIYDFGTAFGFHQAFQRDHMNVNWTVDHCCLFENTTDFQAGLTIGTDLLLADPQLSASRTTSTSQADWAVAVTSPCIGAGNSGGNIGFSAADIA